MQSARTHIELLIPIFLLISFVQANDEECKGFLQGSEEHVKVSYKETFRGGEVVETVSVGEVYWAPYDMLGTSSCYDPATANLMYKPINTDNWKSTLAKQEASGPFSKWSIEDIKPCLEYEFQIQVSGEEEEAIFQVPFKLGPADMENIKQSDFVPDIPTDMEADVGANSASLSWKESDCAEAYEMNYIESGNKKGHVTLAIQDGQTEIMLNDLKPCTSYDISLYAILGDKYGEEKSYKIATKPRLDAVSDLEPEITTSMDSMSLRWAAWENVVCINEYEITICSAATGECRDTETITKQEGLPDVTYQALDLTPCSEYTVEIHPLFPETTVESKIFTFKTLSPDADSQSVGEITVESVVSGTMEVQWPKLECATKYRIYSNRSSSDEGWKLMEETSEIMVDIDNITPCTIYRFSVSAVLDDKETSKTESEDVISALDEEHAFEAPDLQVINGDQGADLTWLHAACIESYVVKVCKSQESEGECLEEAVIVENEEVIINHHIRELMPCTGYTLEIIPIITDKQFTARINEFTTTNGIPQAPHNFELALTADNSAIELSWEDVQCSTGFKVYRQEVDANEGEDSEETYLTSELNYRFEDPVPCEKYSFSVTTLVDEQESENSDWFSVTIPPRKDVVPELKILNIEKDNMTLRLNPTDLNRKCIVQEYELVYGVSSASLDTITSHADAESDIILNFQGASASSAIVKGRILYNAGDGTPAVWSAQVSNGNEKGDSIPLTSSGSSTLIPIIVGVLIAVVILVMIGFLVLRKQRNRNNYDAEKAEHDRIEETQKLNDNHPDA
uniref:Fibronectinlike [Oryzias latipes] n=1 Tax=Lepeophtheirus salmonis TaxID=72036 RepID=A0A0K2T470_LEPSM